MNKIYFENLNGLRFIAFFCIFIHHGIFTTDSVVENSGIFHLLEIIKKPACLGVPFFFCLSGFLITYLLLSEIHNYKKIQIGKFYVRRILRIWMLYYIVVIFGFFMFPLIRSYFNQEPYVETATLWKYLLFLSNFDQFHNGSPYGAGLGVTWSLSVEEQFYLIWPVVLSLVNRKYYSHLTLILFITGYILMTFFNVSYVHTLGSMVDISLGAFLAVSCFEKNKLFRYLVKVNKKTILFVYILGILQLYTWSVLGYGNRIFASVFMAFVVFEQCYSKHSLFKMEKFKVISYLGTLTYGLYLLHTICNFLIHNLILLFRDRVEMPLFSDLFLQPMLAFFLTVIAGYLSFTYIEKPLLNLKMKFSLIDTSQSLKENKLEPAKMFSTPAGQVLKRELNILISSERKILAGDHQKISTSV